MQRSPSASATASTRSRSQNVLVVDLMCEPRVYEPGSFSADGFHPSDRGYAIIADLAYPRLATGTGAGAVDLVRPAHAAPGLLSELLWDSHRLRMSSGSRALTARLATTN